MATRLEKLARELETRYPVGIAHGLRNLAGIARGLETPKVSSDPVAKERITDLLEDAIQEYKILPHTPELVTNFWQTFLESSIKGEELDIPVPVVLCDRTSQELEALRSERKMWIPEAKLTYPQLGKIFPEMASYSVRDGSPIIDEYEQNAKGVDVEAVIDAPNRDITQKDFEDLINKQGRRWMRLSTYILTSQASKVLTAQYLDEGGTWSRLPGSCYRCHVVDANFNPYGSLNVRWSLRPLTAGSPRLGFRSEGVKKT